MGIPVLYIFPKEKVCEEKRKPFDFENKKAFPSFVWETLFQVLCSA
jgi:hypothetical protein